MCTAAIDFVGLECSKHLARDPSNPEMPRRESEHLDQDGSPWPVVANLMFLHNVAWVGGEENAILVRNSEVEPEVTLLALSTLQSQRLIRAANDGAGLVEALAQTWDEVVDVDQRRRARS